MAAAIVADDKTADSTGSYNADNLEFGLQDQLEAAICQLWAEDDRPATGPLTIDDVADWDPAAMCELALLWSISAS